MTLKALRLQLGADTDPQGASSGPKGARSYFGGQLVTGTVHLKCVKPKLITGLSLHWTGTAKIFSGFSISGASADRPTLASVTYFDDHVSLLDPAALPDGVNVNVDGGARTYTLGEGSHYIPFTFTLPKHCPTSFQEPYAEVKYAVQLLLTRPAPKPAHKLLVPFTVNGLFDLNHFQHAASAGGRSAAQTPPLVHSAGKKGAGGGAIGPGVGAPKVPKEKKPSKNAVSKLERKLSFLTRLIPRGPSAGVPPIGFSVQLLRDAFVPGEFVQFRVEMWNNTKYEVSDVSLALFQETKYVTPAGMTKTGLRQKLCATDGPIVSARSQEIWETNVDDSLYLQIPPVPPTNLGLGASACSLVSLEYFLQLEMALDGSSNGSVKHGRVKAQIPVVIGNIPLEATFKEFVSLKKGKCAKKGLVEGPEGDYNNNTPKGAALGQILGYPDLCDPSFEEAPNTASFSAPPPPPLAPAGFKGRGKGLGGADPDSDTEDDEFLASLQKGALLDFEFVPKYATYTSIYGLDLAELLGPPAAMALPPTAAPLDMTPSSGLGVDVDD